MFEILFFILGASIGSFLNVLIYRLPLGRSIVYPPSKCIKCERALNWYELVPIISFLLQRGKCRRCGAAISLQYPFVEFLTGLIYVWLFMHYGLGASLLIAIVFAALLVPIVIIDLKHQIIPDQLNICGTVLGLLTLFISNLAVSSAFLGALLGGGVMLLIAIISRGGMGGGDIKMMAWMGLFLGWKLTLVALFLSFVIGGVGSLVLMLCGIKKRKDFIPFGPFLAIGGFTAYVYGVEILTWYFQRM